MKKWMKAVLLFVIVSVLGGGIYVYKRSKESYCASYGNGPNRFLIHTNNNEKVILDVLQFDYQKKEWTKEQYPIDYDKQDFVLTFLETEKPVKVCLGEVGLETFLEIPVSEDTELAGMAFDGTRHAFNNQEPWVMYAVFYGENGVSMPASLMGMLNFEDTDYGGDVIAFAVHLK